MATINTLNTWTNIASTVWDFGSTKITYYLDAMITSQDTVNNKSYIKTKLRSELHYGWASSQNYTFTCSYAPTVSGTNSWYSGTEDITVSISSQEIAHNSDGTKTISLSARAYMSGVGDTTFSGNATLKAIPRASKFTSETSVTIANNGAIDIYPTFSKAVSSYYQTLSIKTTDQSATLFTLNNVSSGTHYYPDATQRQQMYNYIGTSDRYVFSLVLNTYTSNGGTLVGTDLVKKVPILPSYTISLTASSITDTVTTYNTYKGTGNENKIYIANLSKPQFTLSATSSTGSYYGRSVSYKLGSTVITSPYTVTSYTGQSLSFTATDGRKTSNTYTPSSPSFVSIPYFSPTLNATLVRTTSTGSTIDVTINGTYYDGDGLTNLNNTSITLKYTEEGGTEQTVTIPYTVSTSGHTVSFNATYQLTGMNYQKSVQWSITISDKLNITKTVSDTVTQGLPVWNGYRIGDTNHFNVNGTADLFLHHRGNAPTDLNNAITHGTYHIGGTYTNAPSSSAIYGILIVYESRGKTWAYSDSSSWIWQELHTTGGTVYTREGINSSTMSSWKTIPNSLLSAYPVGSVYMSWNSTSPASLFGGTWTQLKNAFIHATNNTTGNGSSGNGNGTATNSHTLTTNQIPAHSHNTKSDAGSGSTWVPAYTGNRKAGASNVYTENAGGGQGHSHNIPYISVFVWRRTA